ncbi:hypothetical protein TRFO_25003 [Tritrichomonas foetus]|uniref:Uncharacterized protein n=1 Tax=Tritrichomonas foetus TaxID=1144522 RepID=A0A1J4K612_9EUKA|nr:hypothetical protein TRFO_25003 [Tritrichomonas foetus]|eukprot:OHT06897.1 hypothetical protein TRFO_25003 [Tritrichomonas foetus]
MMTIYQFNFDFWQKKKNILNWCYFRAAMFAIRKSFSNKLTRSISQLSVEEILLHHNLAQTIRNCAPELFSVFFPKDYPSPSNFNLLIEYALFGKTPNDEKYQNCTHYQINVNAGNFLSSSNEEIQKYIVEDPNQTVLKSLQMFMTMPELWSNSVLTGNFQRIIESLFYANINYLSDEFVMELTVFSLEHVKICAFNELLYSILNNYLPEKNKKSPYISIVLQYAVFYTYNLVYQIKDEDIFYLSMTRKNDILKEHDMNYMRNTQPLNYYLKPIPLPDYLALNNQKIFTGDLADQAFANGFQKFPKKYKHQKTRQITNSPNSNSSENSDKMPVFDLETSKMSAYLILSNVRRAILNDNRLVDMMNDTYLIDLILYCGVFSDFESPISFEAFRILYILFYGYSNYLTPIPLSSEIQEFIDFSADFFIFDSTCLTSQMVNAFPLFWKHRYQTSYKDELIVPEDKLYRMTGPFTIPAERNPLLILLPVFFSEPPLSSQLNAYYLEIFERLNKERINIMGEENENEHNLSDEQMKTVFEIDCTVYEFLMKKFDYFGEEMTFYEAAAQCCPKYSTETKFVDDENHRKATNGGPTYLVNYFQNKFSFFDFELEISQMGSEIQEITNKNCEIINSYFEYLEPKKKIISIIDNKFTHSGNSVTTLERRNMKNNYNQFSMPPNVIVDELTLNDEQ